MCIFIHTVILCVNKSTMPSWRSGNAAACRAAFLPFEPGTWLVPKGTKTAPDLREKMEDRQTHMSQKSIDAVFAGLYAFTDIRSLLRKSAPLHALAPEEKEQILTAVTTIRTAAADIERDLI